MSIATEAKVITLGEKVAELVGAHLKLQSQLSDAMDHLIKANERIAILEQTAMRKPGPKPKDSHG